MKQSINHNILWSQVFADRLVKSKIKNVVISPGSRSTPLVFAISGKTYFNVKVIIDERTAGFFALGLSKVTGSPTVLITTSGTAVAELYPAVVEAYLQRIPLIICTADRPEYLKNTGANQTINQDNIYRNHIRKFYNTGLPKVDYTHLEKLAIKTDEIINTCHLINKGPVQINFPFEKPFEPDSFTGLVQQSTIKKIFSLAVTGNEKVKFDTAVPISFYRKCLKENNGIIFCGGGKFNSSFSKKIVELSHKLGYPVIADGTSPLRFGIHNKGNVIINATAFLKNTKAANFYGHKIILQFGKAPTSNTLLQFFKNSNAAKYSIDENGDLHDPSKTVKRIFKIQPEKFIDFLLANLNKRKCENRKLLKEFLLLEKETEKIKDSVIYKSAFPFEGRIIFEIINNIPNNSNLIISNSTPVRDLEFFAPVSTKNITVFTNRGASGIDGLISTSLGIAAANKKQTYLIIGDIAFYHDLNALLIAKKNKLPISIILVDNNGGGIFNMLPIVKHKNVFDKYFRTKYDVDFKLIIKAFSGNYSLIKSWNSLRSKLINSNANGSFSVLHIKTNSNKSFVVRKQYWKLVEEKIKSFRDRAKA